MNSLKSKCDVDKLISIFDSIDKIIISIPILLID